MSTLKKLSAFVVLSLLIVPCHSMEQSKKQIYTEVFVKAQDGILLVSKDILMRHTTFKTTFDEQPDTYLLTVNISMCDLMILIAELDPYTQWEVFQQPAD